MFPRLQRHPLRNGEPLVYLQHSAQLAGIDNALFSVPEIIDYRTSSKTLEAVAEYSAMTFTVLGLDEPRKVQAGVVTGNFFEVMGLDPVAGRVFDSRDDGEAAAPAMVLTHDYWASTFASDPGVVGTMVEMNGHSVVPDVVGQIHRGHAARAQFFLDGVPVREGGGEVVELVAHARKTRDTTGSKRGLSATDDAEAFGDTDPPPPSSLLPPPWGKGRGGQ